MEGKYQLGKYCFENEEEYNAALHDIKLIKRIKESQDTTNPQIASNILKLIELGKISVKSKFGEAFIKELQNLTEVKQQKPEINKINQVQRKLTTRSERVERTGTITENINTDKIKPPKIKWVVLGVVVIAIAVFFVIRHINNSKKINTKGYDEYQVLDMYMEACLKKNDSKLAYRYTDTSYYKNNSEGYSKDYIKHFSDDLNKYQKEIIRNAKNLHSVYGDFYYEIKETDSYLDSEGVKWNDIYIEIYYFDRYGLKNSQSYRVSLREYPDTGWKVTWISNKV